MAWIASARKCRSTRAVSLLRHSPAEGIQTIISMENPSTMILVKVLSKTAGCLHLKIQKPKNYELFSTDNAISVRFFYRGEPFAFCGNRGGIGDSGAVEKVVIGRSAEGSPREVARRGSLRASEYVGCANQGVFQQPHCPLFVWQLTGHKCCAIAVPRAVYEKKSPSRELSAPPPRLIGVGLRFHAVISRERMRPCEPEGCG